MRLYPLAGEPLAFGYLFASHPPFDTLSQYLPKQFQRLLALRSPALIPSR